MVLRLSFFAFVFLGVAFSPGMAFADSVFVRIGATPAYQVPQIPVQFTARSSAPKGEYTYLWTVDGSLFAQGVDLDTINFVSGGQGQETNVDVALIDANGNIAGEDSYTLRSGSVDLLWEGKTYTPPLYQGKPYPNGNSKIALQAIPHLSENGQEIPANDLVYLWEAGGQALNSISGYGRSSATISPTPFQSATIISVTVTTRGGAYAVHASVSVPIVPPKIVIYEERALGGIQFNRAISETSEFTGDEMTFWAVPFFVMDPGAMTYAWTLNGSPFQINGTNPAVATFRKTGSGAGEYPVGVTIEKQENIFEDAEKTFTLSFE